MTRLGVLQVRVGSSSRGGKGGPLSHGVESVWSLGTAAVLPLACGRYEGQQPGLGFTSRDMGHPGPCCCISPSQSLPGEPIYQQGARGALNLEELLRSPPAPKPQQKWPETQGLSLEARSVLNLHRPLHRAQRPVFCGCGMRALRAQVF